MADGYDRNSKRNHYSPLRANASADVNKYFEVKVGIKHGGIYFSQTMVISNYCVYNNFNRKLVTKEYVSYHVSILGNMTYQLRFEFNRIIVKLATQKPQESHSEHENSFLPGIHHSKNAYELHSLCTKAKVDNAFLSTDFVCFRGLLTEVMCTPYENREGWIICATKYHGTIYLCAYDTPSRMAQRENETEMQKKMSSWGYKFEQYMTDGSNVTDPVDENEEYCCVLRSRLGVHSMVYGAEVDGADPQLYRTPHADLSAFVELKTSKELVKDRDYNTLHSCKLKVYVEKVLNAQPRIILAFDTTSSVVKAVANVNFAQVGNSGRDHWQPNTMFNFLDQFLGFVKQQVTIDDPRVVYQFQRQPNNGNIHCTFYKQDPQWTFLPDWFYSKIFTSDAKFTLSN
ncbi:unnamed protein product, partial [Meganyctiphanes norvegica]